MKTFKYVPLVIVISAMAVGCSEKPAPTDAAVQPEVVAVSPAPSPAPPVTPTAGEWWQQRPFDPQWIVDTIAAKYDVTSEPTDVEHLREKRTDADRKAYIDYLDKQYSQRGARSEN